MKVLVTGGAGFIGSHVVERLLQDGFEVQVMDNLSTGQRINLPDGIKLHKTDIQSKKVDAIFEREKFDAVCHLAAMTNVRKSVADPVADADTNVLGSVNLLEACRKHDVKKFIFSSTGGALYGDTDILPTPETHPTKPISPYGIDKLAVENYLYYYNLVHGLDVISLRYSNVYGPRQDRKGEGGVVAVFIQALIKDEAPTIFGAGNQTRDFVYVADVASANLKAVKSDLKGFQTFNISTGEETSVNDLHKTLTEALGKNIAARRGPAAKGEIQRSCLDNAKARQELGWTVEYDIAKGIAETVAYFHNNY